MHIKIIFLIYLMITILPIVSESFGSKMVDKTQWQDLSLEEGNSFHLNKVTWVDILLMKKVLKTAIGQMYPCVSFRNPYRFFSAR